MFTATVFNQLPMGFQYPVQRPPPSSIYQSQYGGFNPQIPISFQAPMIPRGQSLPPSSRQYAQSNSPYIPRPPPRQQGQNAPMIPTPPTKDVKKRKSKNKKRSKQRNGSANGASDQGLYSDKEKNNLKNSEDRSRSRSPGLENGSKHDETMNNDEISTNQEQPSQGLENTNGDASQAEVTITGNNEQKNSEEKKNRKSRSKKKKQRQDDNYESNITYFQQPPPFYPNLPPYLRVHQQPLYNSYNQVYEESIRRGDMYQKQAKRSTRILPEAKKKLLPHEEDQKKAFPVVGYGQSTFNEIRPPFNEMRPPFNEMRPPFNEMRPPFNPFQSYAGRPNFYAPTAPFNNRQPWQQNQGGRTIVDEQRIDRLRDHIHSLEHELHKLQKKFNKATLNNNTNTNMEPTPKDEDNRTQRQSKRDTIGSPRQTPVIVELNSSTVNEKGREPSPKKNRPRAQSNSNMQQQEQNPDQQSGGMFEPNAMPTANPITVQNSNQPKPDSIERARSEGNRGSEMETKVTAPAKSSREETAARLAHAAAAHVHARQQIPPPPPIHTSLAATQEQPQRATVTQAPANGNSQPSIDTFQPRSSNNLNQNESNNNDASEPNEKKHNRSAEKILDAFERFYMKDGKSTAAPMKVKYIPEESNSNYYRQRNTNNNNRNRSSSRSSQSSSSSSSSSTSSASSASSSTWSSTDGSNQGDTNRKQTNP